jgi:hypothetical protein
MRNAEQYQTYQAFYRRLNDGTYVGWIAHDTKHHDQIAEQPLGKHDCADDARFMLREAVTTWALGGGYTYLPRPLAFVTEKPANATDMGEVEVPYTPVRH